MSGGETLNCGAANGQNQLNTCFTYDAAGNVMQSGTTTYTYDAENRLIANGADSYVYDGDGQRIEKCTEGTNTNGIAMPGTCSATATGLFYWKLADGSTQAESDLGGNWTAAYGLMRGHIASRTDISISNNNQVEVTHFYLQDHLHSTSLVTDCCGNVFNESDYYPYGGERVITQSDANRYKFTGKERDSESGLDNFGFRNYASTMGRWMTPDRLNLTSARLMNPTNTLNKYVYGGNNPLKYIDKDGKDITIFYRPPSGASGDYGHIMLGALNQATGKAGFLDYYPAGNVNGLGQGPGAFNTGNMSERAEQNAEAKFATLTIQTSPEEAQKVIDLIEALKNGSTPDYSALTNNCTTVCEDVLHDLGLDFGDIFPSSYWANVYNNFSADAQAHPIWTWMMGVHSTPGNEYGNPRNFPGVNNFSQWLFTLYQNQQQQPQPKACVEVDDGLGNHSTSCD
ncbi:MAG: RHS repeat-associated core domain-containing protein [Candidatus Sulfotelmatobacter sp.]